MRSFWLVLLFFVLLLVACARPAASQWSPALLHGGSLAATLYDAESTVHNLRLGYEETNPFVKNLFGDGRPSIRVYAVSMIPFAVGLAASEYARHQHKWYWWTIPAVSIVVHSIAGTINRREARTTTIVVSVPNP